MAKFTAFSVFCALLQITRVLSKKQADLEIITQHVPDDCYHKSGDGDELTVHYTGTVENGQIFDSSIARGEPFSFTLGQSTVIRGWEMGLQDMCVGEKRKLKIPPQLGYGARGSPPKIPPDATLIFETELVGLKKETFDKIFMRLVRFLGLPALTGLIVYYLYYKYQRETTERAKEERKERGKKKRR